MFGYIKPFEPELKMSEYRAYKGVYCGLCKRLSSAYGPFSRLSLSYDFVFLSMLGMALSDEEPAFKNEGCFLNPIRRTPCCSDSAAQEYSAGVAMLLLYHKAMDNLSDSDAASKLAVLPALPLIKAAYTKAAGLHPELAAAIEGCMERQRLLEKERCESLDLACEPTALILSAIFEPLAGEPAQKRVINRLGYLMGRYVYMADALDDMEKDEQRGSYNPLLLSGGDMEARRENALNALYLTIAEIGASWELLETRRMGPILDNIILLGLKNTVDSINLKRKGR